MFAAARLIYNEAAAWRRASVDAVAMTLTSSGFPQTKELSVHFVELPDVV